MVRLRREGRRLPLAFRISMPVVSMPLALTASAKPFRAGAYRERAGFMHELRRDGIYLRSPRRSEFGRLARSDPRIDREFLTFLPKAVANAAGRRRETVWG